MPVHDWKKGFNGVFHTFHQLWAGRLMEILNRELPRGYHALLEQNATGVSGRSIEADILALQRRNAEDFSTENAMGERGGAAVIFARPKATVEAKLDLALYARKQSRVVIRHSSRNRVVAIVEILSPGNKSRRLHFDSFVEKVRGLIYEGVHFAFIDMFPPSKFDPHGLHAEIWESIGGEADTPFDPLKPLTAASYDATHADGIEAFVEPLAFGERIPNMPLFLRAGEHVAVPFEETYQSAWNALPLDCREQVESGKE